MTLRVVIISIFFSNSILAQSKQCGCATNRNLAGNNIECTTTNLTNGYKLYWQFNCNFIWLTLETKQSKKIIIDRVDTMFQDLVYRLGFNLVKEFKSTLLFTYGCPANGPCNYILIDKYSGRKLKKFGVLIGAPQKGDEYNFVIYLSPMKDYLRVYFPDSGKLLQIPVDKQDFFYTVPEYQFDQIQLHKNVITLTYETSRSPSKSVTKTQKIDISKYSD